MRRISFRLLKTIAKTRKKKTGFRPVSRQQQDKHAAVKKSYFFLYYVTFFLAPSNVMKKADKASRVMSDKKASEMKTE